MFRRCSNHPLLWLSSGLMLTACCLAPAGASEDVIHSPMYKAPDIFAARQPQQAAQTIKASWLGLWLKALERPEADFKCKAADAIVLAHRRGFKGLEAAVTPLIAALDRPDQHPAARLAAARALLALEARQAAASLLRQAQASPEIGELVEPVLARWDYKPARAVWLQRLRGPAPTRRSLLLAVECLRAVREGEAAGRLRELVFAPETPMPVRLAAAGALGELREQGLEQDAERLAADAAGPGPGTRLAAAALLRRHKGEQAVAILLQLVKDREPAVIAPAAARLLEIDGKLLLPALAGLLANRDAAVRSVAVGVMAREPTDRHIALLADRLDDLHPRVRAGARAALQKLAADPAWRGRVIAEATRILSGQSWRGLEQAAILLARLDHKPAAGRLVELLRHDRLEAGVAAAWALRELGVRETLPGVLKYLESALDVVGDPGRAPPLLQHQVSQLNQFLGKARYAPADAALRRLIPRSPRHTEPAEARASAIWALGLIHEGKPETGLVRAVQGRLDDVLSQPPEDVRVRWMSAVALGRMKAESALPSLRKYYEADPAAKDPACRWAIEQITGERLPPIEPPPPAPPAVGTDWFLLPND